MLRIEDHDRQRCRPAFEAALLDDLEALGYRPDEPPPSALRTGARSPYRQADNDAAYRAAADELGRQGRTYTCECTRSTFAAWSAAHRGPWSGRGCPGGCATRRRGSTAGPTIRVDLGEGDAAWEDLHLGTCAGPVAPAGDPVIRDRHGNWTYGLCVVVDDLRHGIDLVVRGEDLLESTPMQLRLAALLGRPAPPRFLHHGLVRRADGRKLSKADGATGVRELLAAGRTAGSLRREAAAAIGLAG